jgi:S-DNA-T family DNA segregation ATPase FtsK/SpoIIIE
MPVQLATPVNMTKAEPQPGTREFNAPPPPACTVPQLEEALRKIGMLKGDEQLAILAVPQREKDGNTTVVFDLPAGQTVAKLQDKIEVFAGAIGRDSSMVDIEKKGSAVRTSLWIADQDPFEDVRPSPLLKNPGQLDAFKEGVPVGWGKRGNTILLPISTSNTVIGGTTRSGKGVGASNLVVGAAFDPRINLRIIAGKQNGEWDAYAKAGVASTYFKQDPDRLVALLEAEIADKNRREAELGRLGKSKLVAPAIEQVGGIELIVIDEAATFTRTKKHRRDEIMEKLVLLASVAAGAGILIVFITQYPNADVFPSELAVNFTTSWAMRVDNAEQSNAILGKGQSGMGRDASKFDPPRPGLGWLVNPFAGITDKARSFDIDEDERGEITGLLEKAAKIREAAGRLAGQWDDPIERHLLNATGLSSAAGGPKRDGIPGRNTLNHTPEQRMQIEALRGCLTVMRDLGRDVAQVREMAELISGSMTETRLGKLLRDAGAGGTVKVDIDGAGRVNGYQRADIADALALLEGN